MKVGLIGVNPNAVAAAASLTEHRVEKMQCIAIYFRFVIFSRIYLGQSLGSIHWLAVHLGGRIPQCSASRRGSDIIACQPGCAVHCNAV